MNTHPGIFSSGRGKEENEDDTKKQSRAGSRGVAIKAIRDVL
jgi:hypothetical protein